MKFEEASKEAQEQSVPARAGIKQWGPYYFRGTLVVAVVALALWLIAMMPVWTTSTTPKPSAGTAESTVPQGWNDYVVPPAGSDPLVVQIGYRFACFNTQIRDEVELKKEGFGTSKFRYELVSKTGEPTTVEILIADSKEEAQRITPGC